MSDRLSDKEIRAFFKEAKAKVQVSCDEYEAHSARKGCLSGDPQAIIICKLCEELEDIREEIRKLAHSIESKG